METTFAPDAKILLVYCESAQGGTQSVGYAFKEILPDATIHGYTGKVYAIPYDIKKAYWAIFPWLTSRKVEIELEEKRSESLRNIYSGYSVSFYSEWEKLGYIRSAYEY